MQKSGVVLLILLYVSVLILFSLAHFKYVRYEQSNQINQELINAAHAARAILGKDFHDELTNQDSISYQQDYAAALRLYDYARSVGIAYLYSFKRFDDEILFTASSATDEELALEVYDSAYFTRYPEMDPAVEVTFDTGVIQFAEYHDRWGSFRSVFVPFQNSQGETYVVGADMTQGDVESALFKSFVYAFILTGLFAVLVVPVMYLFVKAKKQQWQMKYQLLFKDSLTGLPNKNQLLTDLKKAQHIHLGLIDIKKFSDVTNTYGPAVGDHILKQFAVRLDSFKHDKLDNYKVYRLDGDVFAILEDQNIGVDEIKAGSEELITYLVSHRYQVNSNEYIRLNVVVGGVNQNDDAFMLANMALEEAKRQKIQSFVYDNKSDNLPETYKTNSIIKHQLIEAIEQHRLVPFYQPIFNAHDKQLAKYECLARIVDEQGDVLVAPQQFIPVAKRAGIYSEITQVILAHSIAFAQTNTVIISINLSISDIMNTKTRVFLYRSVRESNIAERIQFEILETEAIEDLSQVTTFILKLQSLGAKVGIDDLGRSYSNFDRLTHLPLDFIKIDGSIITSIANDEDAQRVTREIVAIAKRHNMKVTAEYCYDEATTAMAINLGVDYLQGFHLGKPQKKVLE
ncbi:GGDEF domain-containing phosphodiesterase [Marinicella sp. S1101]|uniref:EAL domain-containing protein n=1 Tax=Marinicella marina TaxID=2996016 RepID=UPI002260AE53|nr:GGDEF domain-containing phosphodiesterase [Marinicella marina]MCX7554254.1 GGDEF domain-containing phosphodiesterase [Marinicella marina]MDJ1138753.1 GGDEF domain-containing phosphodiesterase [Marinicella marina]